MEYGALLDVVRVLELIEDERYGVAKAPLERIVAMLTRMCRKVPAPSAPVGRSGRTPCSMGRSAPANPATAHRCAPPTASR